MNDIVDEIMWLSERLRADGDPNGDYRESKIAAAAIDEIKRLRNELFGLNAKLDQVRSVAGLAIAEPLTYANIKKQVRNGPSA